MRWLMVLTMLSGCAAQPRQQIQWVHDQGAGRAQLDRDYAQCESHALSQHPLMPVQQGMHIFASCMRGRGWYTVAR